MGFSGAAEVLSVEPFREPVRSDVPVVTGRFVTDAAEVVDLYLAGYDRPIGVTRTHRFYAADRRKWIAANDLLPGECLETAMAGCSIVDRAEPRLDRARVFNLEVSQYHTYFVGEAGVWAHNTYGPFPVSKAGWRVSKFEQKEWITKAFWSMRDAGGAPLHVIRESIVTIIREARLNRKLYEELVAHLDYLVKASSR